MISQIQHALLLISSKTIFLSALSLLYLGINIEHF